MQGLEQCMLQVVHILLQPRDLRHHQARCHACHRINMHAGMDTQAAVFCAPLPNWPLPASASSHRGLWRGPCCSEACLSLGRRCRLRNDDVALVGACRGYLCRPAQQISPAAPAAPPSRPLNSAMRGGGRLIGLFWGRLRCLQTERRLVEPATHNKQQIVT